MQYILVEGDVIAVNTYASYSIELNVIGAKVRYKPQLLSEGGFMTIFAQHLVAIIGGWLL